jgi:hypothetical protein
MEQVFQLDGHDVGEYKVAQGGSIDELVKKVNALIQKEWFPLGGPVVGNDPVGKSVIIQALIRSKLAGKRKISL